MPTIPPELKTQTTQLNSTQKKTSPTSSLTSKMYTNHATSNLANQRAVFNQSTGLSLKRRHGSTTRARPVDYDPTRTYRSLTYRFLVPSAYSMHREPSKNHGGWTCRPERGAEHGWSACAFAYVRHLTTRQRGRTKTRPTWAYAKGWWMGREKRGGEWVL